MTNFCTAILFDLEATIHLAMSHGRLAEPDPQRVNLVNDRAQRAVSESILVHTFLEKYYFASGINILGR